MIEPELIVEVFATPSKGLTQRLGHIQLKSEFSFEPCTFNVSKPLILSFWFVHLFLISFARIHVLQPVLVTETNDFVAHRDKYQYSFINSIIRLKFSLIGQFKKRASQQLLKMIKKKMWLMSNSEFDSFEKYRLQRYRASEIRKDIDDHLLTKFFTNGLVHFFRRKRISKDDPFKTERLLHTAVCLFKRFHLVNEYSQSLGQNFYTCAYLSLKINQLPYESIIQIANTWKTKMNKFIFGEQCCHFKDPGYSDKQLYFLRGIGFQIGRSPLIPGVQSLCHRVTTKNPELKKQFQQLVFELIRRVYIDDKAIFLFEGPKLALAIVTLAIRMKQAENKLHNKLEDLLGADISTVMERNRIEVEQIINYIQKLEKIDGQWLKQKAQELRDKILKMRKNTYDVPQRKSPKLTPLTFQFEEH